MKRYLIIQTAFLGDTILTEPLIETIKANDVESEIGVLIIPENEAVFSLNPKVNYIIKYDKNNSENTIFDFSKKIKIIRNYEFNYVLSPHMSFRSSLLSYFSNAKIRIGFKDADFSFLYSHVVKKSLNSHAIDKNLQLVEPLGYKKKIRNIMLYYSKSDENVLDGIKEAYSLSDSDKIVVINPTSVWPTKRWPKENFKKLVSMLANNGIFIILIGKKRDIQLINFIKDKNKNVINAAGTSSLKELFALIANSNLLISNDSAPIHIATAFNRPTIDIFGPTLPEFGFTPLSNKNKIFEIKNLDCRPCGKHGGISCKKGHFRCMIDIDVEDVYKATLELI